MTRVEVIVDLPEHDKYTCTVEIDLANNLKRLARDNLFVFNAQEVLHIGNSKVYKGTLTAENDAICPWPVVCKIVEGDTESRLKKEAEIYAKNKKLQGPLLPRFFYHCSGTSVQSNTTVTCLVTRYMGKCLQTRWGNTPMEIRYKAWICLRQLHLSGVYHGDFVPRNVVIADDGQPRIVDFDHGSGKHQCPAVQRVYKLYEPEPSPRELCCDELYEVAIEMDLWTPRWCSFLGLEVQMSAVHSVEDVLRYVEKHQPQTPDIYSNWMQSRAADFLRDYHDHYITRLQEVESFWRIKFLGIKEPKAVSPGNSEVTSPLMSQASVKLTEPS